MPALVTAFIVVFGLVLGLFWVTVRAVGCFFTVLRITVATAWTNPRTSGADIGALPLTDGEPSYRAYVFGPVFRDLWGVFHDSAGMSMAHIAGNSLLPERYSEKLGGRPFPRILVAPEVSFLTELTDRTQYADKDDSLRVFRATAELIGVLIGAVLAAMFLSFIAVVCLIALAGVVLAAATAAFLLRSLEFGLTVLRHITIECVNCHHRVVRPVYRCPEPACRAEHGQLLPGRFGIFRHVCRCETRMVTLLLLGKGQMEAMCEKCKTLLPEGAATTRTAHVSIVAGPSAGKTLLLKSAAISIQGQAGRPAITVPPEDLRPARIAIEQRDLGLVPATRPTRFITPWTFTVGTGRHKRLVYAYDPPGEHLWSADSLSGWTFLDHTTGIILVIDPLSIPHLDRVRDALSENQLSYSRVPPIDVLSRTVDALRTHEVLPTTGTGAVPLAVVITKGDLLLETAGATHPYDQLDLDTTGHEHRDEAVRQWLQDAGQAPMLRSITNAFGTARWFVTSAFDAAGVQPTTSARTGRSVLHDDPADVLLWLLRPER